MPAKYKQGSVHGFVVVKDSSGKIIAVGDQTNMVHGNEVYSHLIFHFRNGSIDDERTVFIQGRILQLVSDHHIQKGPSFKKPLNLEIMVPTGAVRYHKFEGDKDEVKTDHMAIPPDLANGMMSMVLENYPTKTSELNVSYMATDPKPRIVKLAIKLEGEEPFRVGGSRRRAKRFNVHIELGGIAGVVAPVIGKQPSDVKMWVMDGEVPSFLKMEGAFYQQGPIWTTELATPVWPNHN